MVSQHDLTLCSQEELLSIIAELQHNQEYCQQENLRLRERLHTAQQQLIEAEKMASLGHLVAGMTHEINTPLGISLTAMSQLEELAVTLQYTYQSGQLKRAQLEKYLASVQQGHYLVTKNLTRAIELIQSFKQVAVDQSSEQQRTFKLKSYLKEVILSLQPQFKPTDYQIILECDESIILSSYPGFFAQMITNLIMNSLIHGFQNRATGCIKISATVTAKKSLLLCYSDDGNGIAREVIEHIFEPFFTTNHQGGGSGLGLHIIYNLVTHQLQGSIHCDSHVGQGTTFWIELPLKLEA
ncbi:MAG: HAMP domain-containing sensor histidine kinase [Pseudomonadota bacterium]|nr:HAMP domain-containing sensor histidine kinase [Pseudomonadota bacterium]